MTKNQNVLKWVEEMKALTQPDKVVWIDGSEEQLKALRDEAIATGEMIELNQEKLPGCLYHRTAENDVARVEDRTFIFAITTVTGWWIYGRSCFVYLFTKKWVGVYLAIFIVTAFVGAVIQATVVWDVSDLFNGLMAIPNLLAIILLRKEVKADI